MPRPRLPACVHCRESHIKCDRASPSCSGCRRAKPPKKCVLNRLEIRQSTYTVKARPSFEEEDDSNSSRLFARESRQLPMEAVSRVQSGSLPSSAAAPWGSQLASIPVVASYSPESATHAASPASTSIERPLTAPNPRQNQTRLTAASPTASARRDSTTRRGPRRTRVVSDSVEQYVFEFYINYAGPWIDIVSSQNHFAQDIPRLALNEPMLYYSCLAYASMVLHLNEGLDKSVHEAYQNQAIAILIPRLSDYVAAADKALLATAVILRMTEQFTEIDEDAEHHLRGAGSLFSTAQERWSPSMIDARGVAFWIFVRQSIRANFLNEQGCRFDLSHVDADCSSPTDHEEVWANRVTFLLAKLCDGCWGDFDSEIKESMRTEVAQALDKWVEGLPDTFQPWYFSRSDYQAFPMMKYLSPWHEIAWQKYYASRVMLAVYGADRPGPDSNILEVNRYLESEIIEPARMACGVVFSSGHIGCPLNGCHLAAWCGQFFTGKEEQRTLANFLEAFTMRTNWPNRTCHDRLEDIWSGTRKTWSGR